jgi:hypothetical protein
VFFIVHKRRYIVIGYGGSRLFPIKEYNIVRGTDVAAEIRILRKQPYVKGIQVEPATIRNVLREMSFPLSGIEAEQALWKDIPRRKEVIMLETKGFGLPKYKRIIR